MSDWANRPGCSGVFAGVNDIRPRRDVSPARVSLTKDGRPERSAGGAYEPDETEAPFEGWLARAIRMPVRIVTLVLIVPVRMLWDALAVCGRALKRGLWVPFARAAGWLWRSVLAPVLFALLVWPWLALWRYVLAPVGRALRWLAEAVGAGLAWSGRGVWAALAWAGRTLVVAPLSFLYRWVLTPAGHGLAAVARALGAGLAWLGRMLVVAPSGFLYRWVLTPLGHAVMAVVVGLGVGLAWLWRYCVVVPCGFLHRYVIRPAGRAVVAVVLGMGAGLRWLWQWLIVAPCRFVYRWVLRPTGRGIAVVAREIGDALVHAWRVAGYVSRAVFGFAGRVLRLLFADPAVWLWRHVACPAGRAVRDGVWRPAARAVREAGRGARAALAAARASVRETRAEIRRALFGGPPLRRRAPEPVPEPVAGRTVRPEAGRVPWGAGSPHNSATAPATFGSKHDDADFRTL